MKPKPPPPDFSWLLLADREQVKLAAERMKGQSQPPKSRRKKR